jgi:hypothetical protein
MISLCTSWALLSLSIVTLMVYLPVEISTAVLSFYLYNMVPTMLLGSYFLLNPLLQRKSNERNGSFRIELVIWYGTFLALAVVKSYLNLLACSGIWAPVNCPIFFSVWKISTCLFKLSSWVGREPDLYVS